MGNDSLVAPRLAWDRDELGPISWAGGDQCAGSSWKPRPLSARYVLESGQQLTYILAWGWAEIHGHGPNWNILCRSRSFGCLVTGAGTCPRFSLVTSSAHIAKPGATRCFLTAANADRLFRGRTGFYDGLRHCAFRSKKDQTRVLKKHVSKKGPVVAGRRGARRC